MSDYVFWCRRCKFDHAGECRSPYSYEIVHMVEALERAGWKVETYTDSKIELTATVKLEQPLKFIPIVFRTTEDSPFET